MKKLKLPGFLQILYYGMLALDSTFVLYCLVHKEYVPMIPVLVSGVIMVGIFEVLYD